MIRLALPKGRNLEPALGALRAAGLGLAGFEGRRLRQTLEADGVELLLFKDWDLPLYVEHGIADVGIVGTDVLAEVGCDLLTPLSLLAGRSRMSLIGTRRGLPAPGAQIRVATKYPRWARRLLSDRPWGLEIVRLSGSVELGPLLELAELAVDVVQTGATLREHELEELEVLAEIAPLVVVNRAAYQWRRAAINRWMRALEDAGVVS
ncbi:MAG TPA: ATP phosphoribosyltransferase [Thermoanaerobaculia bacterium]|nr:ATP phosphoribosyltransferase [Thermoanaerobaculia bacterium]